MSDVGLSGTIGVEQEHVPQGEITAGTMMRKAREAAGLHVAALAVSMKIPVKKLEALEADRLDLLHDAVFVRALAASVCRALKIDPSPILNKLPLNTVPKLNPDERGINAPFHSPNDAMGMTIPGLLTKPSTLFVLVLLSAGIAVFFSPDIKLPEWVAELSSQSIKSSDGVDHPQAVPPPAELVDATPEPAVTTTSAAGASSAPMETVAVAPMSMVASGIQTPLPKASAPSSTLLNAGQPTNTASSPTSAPALPSTGMVVFKAKGPTWVKVVDAKGVVQLSKTIVNGELVGASGTAPLSVVVGRVDVTDVEVRGKPFVLTGVSKDNVARFEVK